MRQAVSYLGPQLPQQAALLGALSRWVQVGCCKKALLPSSAVEPALPLGRRCRAATAAMLTSVGVPHCVHALP